MRRCRGMLAGMAVGLWVAVAATTAWAACPPLAPAVQVRVNTPPVDVAYRTDLDRRQLASLAGMAAVHNTGILGLTISRYALRASTDSSYARTADKRVCLWVTAVEATLSIPEMTVFVAREYAPGTCQYDAVMAHEQEHVRVTSELLQPFARHLEEELKARLAAVLPVVAPTPAAAEREARRQLETAMAVLIEELEARRERANAFLDTEQSYRRTAAQCSSW